MAEPLSVHNEYVQGRSCCGCVQLDCQSFLASTVDIHSLRHSFATWIGESGISPKAAQKLMRHSDVNLTMRYTHARDEVEMKAFDALPAARLNSGRQSHNATGTGSLAPMLAPDSVHGNRGSHRSRSESNTCDNPARNHGRHPATKKAENSGNSTVSGSDGEVHPGGFEPPTPGSEGGAKTHLCKWRKVLSQLELREQ